MIKIIHWPFTWLQKRQEQRKIKQYNKLMEALQRPENYRRRPAAKYTLHTGPG